MPIYEYQCPKCGTFEITQRITEKPLNKCPTCKGKVKKLISNTSFQLKGTGWYVTDYARKGQGDSKGENGAKASSESKTAAESKTTSEPKTESKKDSKSESSSSASEKSSSASSSTSA
jgi:putative FmdB family regulatory protein